MKTWKGNRMTYGKAVIHKSKIGGYWAEVPSVPHPPPPDFRRFRDRRKPRFRAAQNHAQSQFCRNFTYCDMCARMCGFCFPLHAKVRIFPYFRVFHPLFTVSNPALSAMPQLEVCPRFMDTTSPRCAILSANDTPLPEPQFIVVGETPLGSGPQTPGILSSV